MEAWSMREANEEKHAAQMAFYNQKMKTTEGSAKHPRLKYPSFKDLYNFEEAIDNIRNVTEGLKQPSKVNKINRAKLFAERLKTFEKLKRAGKIIPWDERTKNEREI